MESNDFRERLKGHIVPTNPAPWEQMEELLDATPENDSKRKKRPFFWIFLLGGLFIGLGLIYSSTIHDKSQNLAEVGHELPQRSDDVSMDKSSEAKPTLSQSEELLNESQLASSSSFPTDQRNEDNDKSHEDQWRDELNENVQISNGAIAGNLSENEQVNTAESERKEYVDSKNSLGARDRVENEILLKRSTVDGNAIKGNGVDENISNVITTNLKLSNEESDDIEQDDASQIRSPQESHVQEVIANRGNWDSLAFLDTRYGFLQYEGDEMVSPKIVKPVLPSKFFWFAGLGYSSFNGNPGMISSVGVVYDVDRIIDLESNLSYVYGKGERVVGTEEVTHERQFDINILVHLNFVKNRKNKLSLDLGGGFTFYNGQRIISSVDPTIDLRSSRGRNLQLAISYHRRISNDISVGLRLGAIAYDDAIAYISTRFLKRF